MAKDATPERFTVMVSGYGREALDDARKAGVHTLYLSVPWGMVEPHEEQAQRNHNQSLKGLNGRGGLSASELVAVLEDREHSRMPLKAAYERVGVLLHAYEAKVRLGVPQADS